MAESRRHRELKRVSAGWLRSLGWVAVGDEVHLPAGGFRADVAGWTDRRLEGEVTSAHPRVQTVIIECKVSRPDAARDTQRWSHLLARRSALMDSLRQQGVASVRSIRRDSSDSPNLFDLRHTVVNSVQRRVRRIHLELIAIDRKLEGRAKCAKMAWWRVADALWLATPSGLLSPAEVPAGWGLLEWDGGQMVREVLRPTELGSSSRDHSRVLRGIAISGTRGRWAGAMQRLLPIA